MAVLLHGGVLCPLEILILLPWLMSVWVVGNVWFRKLKNPVRGNKDARTNPE